MKSIVLTISMFLIIAAQVAAQDTTYTNTQAPLGGLGDWLRRTPVAVFILALIIWRISQANRRPRK
jgi:hypothetical protein